MLRALRILFSKLDITKKKNVKAKTGNIKRRC